jgi:hypothetical protein
MPRIPTAIRALAVFFLFSACMSALTCTALLLPGGALEPIWELNPESHEALVSLGPAGIWLMVVVSVACASSAYGLATVSRWGHRLALSLLTISLVGDVGNAIFRHDYWTLIGVPIGGLLIAYLLQHHIIALFNFSAMSRGLPHAG